jgi:hypothetical protein
LPSWRTSESPENISGPSCFTKSTLNSDEKEKLAKSHGCDHVIVYTRDGLQKRVVEIIGNNMVKLPFQKTKFDFSVCRGSATHCQANQSQAPAKMQRPG